MPDRHAIVSASGASRWLKCTAAPRFEEQFEDAKTVYSEEGTLAHSICELYARKNFTVMNQRTFNSQLKKLQANELYNDEMLVSAQTYVDYLAETAMAFTEKPFFDFEIEVDLSTVIPEGFGTADSVMIGGDRLHITDYKNGKGVAVSAVDNPQMKLYAIGALNKYRLIFGDSIKRVTMAIIQPRLSEHASEWETTTEELLAWGESIKPKAEEAFRGDGSFVPGEHCRFCRGANLCRARAKYYAGFDEYVGVPIGAQLDPATLAERLNSDDPVLTDADIGEILTAAKDIVNWYNGIKEYALKAILQGRTIPGYKAVEGKSNRKWTDQAEAFKKLIKEGIQQDLLYERKPLTLSQVESLIGKKKFSEMLKDYVVKPQGAPTLALESDKKPSYVQIGAAEFKGVGDG